MKRLIVLIVLMSSPAFAIEIPTVTGEPPHMVAQEDGTGYQPDVDFDEFYKLVEPGSAEDIWSVSGGE